MGIFDQSYSSVELSRILGVHRVTVAKWIKQGALKAAKTPGGRYKVSRRDLKEFLQERGIPLPSFLESHEKKLVVAVDDDEAVLAVLEKFFSTGEMHNLYDLKTFSDPVNAALFIGHAKPGLLLMDLLMPKLNGFDLAEKIKHTSPHTRIIVITGYATVENLRNLRNPNIDSVIQKPFSLSEVKREVEQSLLA